MCPRCGYEPEKAVILERSQAGRDTLCRACEEAAVVVPADRRRSWRERTDSYIPTVHKTWTDGRRSRRKEE